jgi:hypothetical protein
MAFAAAETAGPAAALASSSTAEVPTYTARGDIKFVDSSTLVIQQISPYSGKNMTFVGRRLNVKGI